MSTDYFEQELEKNTNACKQLIATADQLRTKYHEDTTQSLADWFMAEATSVITREQTETTKMIEDSALREIKAEIRELMARADDIVRDTIMHPSLWQDFSKPFVKVDEMNDLLPAMQNAGQNLSAVLRKHGYKITFTFTGSATMATLLKQYVKTLSELVQNLRQKSDILERRAKFEVKRRWENA